MKAKNLFARGCAWFRRVCKLRFSASKATTSEVMGTAVQTGVMWLSTNIIYAAATGARTPATSVTMATTTNTTTFEHTAIREDLDSQINVIDLNLF